MSNVILFSVDICAELILNTIIQLTFMATIFKKQFPLDV